MDSANSGRNKREATPKQKAAHAALQVYRWQKGMPSPNPSGRPKKKPITDAYREMLELPAPPEIIDSLGLHSKATMADVIARRMTIRAVNGSKAVEAAKEIREAVEGKTPQGDKGDSTVQVFVTYDGNRAQVAVGVREQQ